jgi:hypothetical protein
LFVAGDDGNRSVLTELPAMSGAVDTHGDHRLRTLLGLLISSLDCEDDALAEPTFSSDGQRGALVYPMRAQVAARFRRLFDADGVAPVEAAVLWAFLAHLPAERHAVRLCSNGSIGVLSSLTCRQAASERFAHPSDSAWS